jgi:hypothetical protein
MSASCSAVFVQHISIMGETALRRLLDSPPSIFERYISKFAFTD